MNIETVLKGLMVGVVIVLVVSVVFIKHHDHFLGFHILYGAIGAGFFLLATRILSVIQKEGRQDD